MAEKNGLQLLEPDKVFNIPFDRSPLSKDNVIAYNHLATINSTTYDVIHCNIYGWNSHKACCKAS